MTALHSAVAEATRHQGGDVSHLGRVDHILTSSSCVNPYGPPTAALAAVAAPYLARIHQRPTYDGLTADDIREHPERAGPTFVHAYAHFLDVDPAELTPGHGISAFLQLLTGVLHNPVVIVPDYTKTIARFAHYPGPDAQVTTWQQRAALVEAALAAGHDVILSNPCNPLGVVIPTVVLAQLAARYPHRLLVVDEAYAEFLADGSTMLEVELDNVVVLRSPNKAFGLASARAAVLWTRSERVTAQVRARGLEWSVSGFDGPALIAALDCGQWFADTRWKLLTAAVNLGEQLVGLFGADAVPGAAAAPDQELHFQFVHLPDTALRDRLWAHLAGHGVSPRVFLSPAEGPEHAGRVSGVRLVAPRTGEHRLSHALDTFRP